MSCCAKANQVKSCIAGLQGQWQQNLALQLIYQESEQSHGRIMGWTVSVFENLGNFDVEWAGLKRCIAVERKGARSGRAYEERQYYISTCRAECRVISSDYSGALGNRKSAALGHKFMSLFGEDNAPQRGRFAAANLVSLVIEYPFINVARKCRLQLRWLLPNERWQIEYRSKFSLALQ